MKQVLKSLEIIFMVVAIIISYGYSILFSHILDPLKLDNFGSNKQIKYLEDKPIYIVESDKLNKDCYNGTIDDRLNNYKFAVGIFNYLCEEYHLIGVNINLKTGGDKNVKSGTMAYTGALKGITLYYDVIGYYANDNYFLSHLIFHEYVHLIMFRQMANGLTIDYKSNKIINSVSKSYINLPEEYLYPSEYAESSKREQIAEILGYYLSNRIAKNKNSTIYTSNFEQDLYKQFMNNVTIKKS